MKSAAFQSGCCWASSATAPVTCGVAIEVPDAVTYEAPTGSPRVVPAARAAVMSWPGATMSGLTAKSPIRGPRLEKSLRASCLVVLPTVSAESAMPGEPTVPPK